MHETIPKIGIHGVKGVLNGLGVSGCFFRSIRIARHTDEKASNVPSETSLLKTPIGNSHARVIATNPNMIVDIYGVLNFG